MTASASPPGRVAKVTVFVRVAPADAFWWGGLMTSLREHVDQRGA